MRIQSYKIPVIYNPFGITYNPISIANQITSLHDKRKPNIDVISDRPYPFEHHGVFRKESVKETEDFVFKAWKSAQEQFSNTNICIFTLGSAYAWKRNNIIVNNCHKRPSKEFVRELVPVNEIFTSLKAAFSLLPRNCTIICTVSPVRHIRDGLLENNISKSTLRISLHELERQDTRIQYFPSFEMMMDDLRDYRFYDNDLLHPSKMAIEYIWNKFKEYAFDPLLEERYKDIQSLHKRLSHRPLHPDSPEFALFVQKTVRLLSTLQNRYPSLDWESERESIVRLTSICP